MTAEFYALKGMFLTQMNRSEDANKAFSAAVQMHDTLVKAWALWGDYLESLFIREKCVSVNKNYNKEHCRYQLHNHLLDSSPCLSVPRNGECDFRSIPQGVNAITCYLHACRHQKESKSRKYLAKVLWLLTYDDDKNTLAEAVDKYCVGVPPIQWLPW